MWKSLSLLRISAGNLGLFGLAVIVAPAQIVLREVHQGAVPYQWAEDRMNMAWSNGAFLQVLNDASANPELRVLSLDGRAIGSFGINIDGARMVRTRGVARSPLGSVGVSGFAISETGQESAFIEIFPDAGVSPQIIRTEPFVPKSIVMWPDGTFWSIGHVNQKSKVADADPNGGTLRHYDGSGRLIGSYYPETQLDDDLRSVTGYLAGNPTRIGWISWGDKFSAQKRSGAYVEVISKEGRTGDPESYPLPPLSPDRGGVIYGLAILDDGSVYVSADGPDLRKYIYTLDRSQKTWQPVIVDGLPAPLGRIIFRGASGRQIAFSTDHAPLLRFLAPK